MNKFNKILPVSDYQYKGLSRQDASKEAQRLTEIAVKSGQFTLLGQHLALLVPIMEKGHFKEASEPYIKDSCGINYSGILYSSEQNESSEDELIMRKFKMAEIHDKVSIDCSGRRDYVISQLKQALTQLEGTITDFKIDVSLGYRVNPQTGETSNISCIGISTDGKKWGYTDIN